MLCETLYIQPTNQCFNIGYGTPDLQDSLLWQDKEMVHRLHKSYGVLRKPHSEDPKKRNKKKNHK